MLITNALYKVFINTAVKLKSQRYKKKAPNLEPLLISLSCLLACKFLVALVAEFSILLGE